MRTPIPSFPIATHDGYETYRAACYLKMLAFVAAMARRYPRPETHKALHVRTLGVAGELVGRALTADETTLLACAVDQVWCCLMASPERHRSALSLRCVVLLGGCLTMRVAVYIEQVPEGDSQNANP